MQQYNQIYIRGTWVETDSQGELVLQDSFTEAPLAQVMLGSAYDAERAVLAARSAFENWSRDRKSVV